MSSTPSGAADERRQYRRIRTDSTVSIGREDPPTTLANAVDLSMTGLRFECVGLELEVGEMVRIALTLGMRTLLTDGRILRARKLDSFTQEVALAFAKSDPETQRFLADLLPEAQDGDAREDPRDQ